MSEERNVSLETLGNGAAVEMFNRELQNVLDNITDINTPATAVRKVVLEVAIKPNEEREVGIVAVAASSKLAPVKAVGTMVYIGKQNGKAVARENNPRQMAFDALSASSSNN